MAESEKTPLSHLVTTITFLSFIFGIAKLTLFYGKFSFDVFEYIDIAEIFNNTIRDAFYIAVPFLIINFYNYSLIGKGISTYQKDMSDVQIQRADKRIKFFVDVTMGLVAVYYLVRIIISYFNNTTINYNYVVVLIFYAVVFILRILISFDKHLKTNHNYQIPKNIMIVLFLSIGMILAAAITTLYRTNHITPTSNDNNTFIILKDDTIKSTTKYYYIGRTKNYIFFHNDTSGFTDVFPDKDVRKVSIKD